jgi:hypothetical protein
MVKNSTQPVLLQKLFELLERHRCAFGQERVYWRAVGMVMGELFNFGRHTVTQGLMALGVTDGDWSGWYRLFSQGATKSRECRRCFLGRPSSMCQRASRMSWEWMECRFRGAA